MKLQAPEANPRAAVQRAAVYPQAAERNCAPILDVLREELPDEGTVLEVASGSGYHAVHFARSLPRLRWQPTDADEEALATIAAYRSESGLFNLEGPRLLDVTMPEWPVGAADAIVCINMLHIAPWRAAEGLFRGAGRLLPAGAPLCTYGPYRFDGEFTAPSNLTFDQSLRARNPAWGVRDLSDLTVLAESAGLILTRAVALPANNHLLVFRRPSQGRQGMRPMVRE